MQQMRKASRIRSAALGTREPRARRDPRTRDIHGETLHDEFAYLAVRDDARTRDYIRNETDYFEACMAPSVDVADLLYEELRARNPEDDVSVPETINGYRYYSRVASGMQYPIHCRARENGDGGEEIYLDENRLVGDGRYCDVPVLAICPRQERFACTVDRSGDERYEVLVASMPYGELGCCAERAGESLAWAGNGRYLFYTGIDDKARTDSVWVYDVERASSHRLFVEPDPAFFVTLSLSRSGGWIIIDIAGNSCSETRVLPADRPLETPTVVFERREDVEYSVEHHEDRFLVLTNDQSEDFRLIEIPASWDGRGPSVELVPHREGVALEFVDAYRHHLVIGERWNGVERVWVWDLVNDSRRYLPGSDALSYLSVDDLYDYDARFVRFEYSTPIKPHTVYDYDVASSRSTWRKTSGPPGYREDHYASEQLQVCSGEVDVPLTMIYRRDTLRDDGCPAPLLLIGYGAYEEPMETEFDGDLISLLDRGVMVAMAHVRGGGDLGPAWHDAGRLGSKENSFRDFCACARFVIDNGYTDAGRIAAWGASAGGLLVAVALNREPQLFASAVLDVPFLDVLNTLLDPELPLTEHDFDEFGDPSVEEEYRWIRAYSPYDNIGEQAYPPMLVSTALNDQRVGYWEALKWVARLRKLKTDDNPLLLRVDAAGHLGETGRYDALRRIATVYTFLLDMWGLIPEAKR